jgi:hypothetical protein
MQLYYTNKLFTNKKNLIEIVKDYRCSGIMLAKGQKSDMEKLMQEQVEEALRAATALTKKRKSKDTETATI